MIKYLSMNSSSWFFPISALINGVTSAVLAFYLLFTLKKNRIARYLFYLCVVAVLWSIPYFFWQISSEYSQAFFWSKFLMFGAIFTSISYLHLVLVYLNLERQKFYKKVLLIFYIFTFIWVSANFTDYFVAGLESEMYFEYWPKAGPLYAPFLLAFVFEFIYASFLLFRQYRKSVGIQRIQVGLMLLGIFFGFIGGSTNYPLWYGIQIAPWGNILASAYVILTVYAMMKYKFMNLKVVSTELFTGLLFIIFLIDVFLSKNIWEGVFRLLGLAFMGFFGLMLVRSVRQEIQRREEVTDLAHSLEKANLRLQELDRQKTEFLSIASHQLRTPLSILKGYIELIKDGAYGKTTSKMTEVLNEMDESNEHLVKLVDDFLNISRIEQGRTKFVFSESDVNSLVSGVVKELSEKARQARLKIVWEPNKNLKKVVMDDEKIRHVVYNFVDNAIKYSHQGKIEVKAEVENGQLVVRVIDSGIGFGREDEVNFFTKFYRGKNVTGTNVNGTGLGLYVCKKFIEAHGGQVWATSPGLGQGSEFGFWIPLRGTGNGGQRNGKTEERGSK